MSADPAYPELIPIHSMTTKESELGKKIRIGVKAIWIPQLY